MDDALFVYGGTVWTGNPAQPRAEAFLAEKDRFTAVGSREYVESKCPSGARRIDVKGSLVIPGMTDSHIHLTAYCKQGMYLDLAHVRSIDEAVRLLKSYIADHPDYHWIRAINFNETNWEEPILPTMKLLDSVDSERGILLSRYCGHVQVVNGRAMTECGLRESSDPNVVRGKDGLPTGLLNEGAASPVLERIKEEHESPKRTREYIRSGCRHLASLGITAVHACDVPAYGLPEDMTAIEHLAESGELPLRVIAFYDKMPDSCGFDGGLVSCGGYKAFVDGNLGGRTAALREDYSDCAGERGLILMSDDELFNILRESDVRNVQVQMHMIGDAAIDQAIRVGKRLSGLPGGRAGYHLRFNHLIVSPPDQLEDMKELGVVVDIQPIQVHTDRHMAPSRLGHERMQHSYSFRRLYDSGLIITGSSDAPVEDPNPWLGIWAAVCRTDTDGSQLPDSKKDEVLTLDEALTIYTKNPYRAIMSPNGYGDISELSKADFVILENNPLDGDKQALKDVKVRETYLDGRRTY